MALSNASVGTGNFRAVAHCSGVTDTDIDTVTDTDTDTRDDP